MSSDDIRAELLSQISRLDAEEEVLRARRSITTYRLEQVLREKDRLQRHLAAFARENAQEGAA